jgi:LysR family transcriptional regulator, hca operon transcriptional activator
VIKDLGAHRVAAKDFVGLGPYLAGIGKAFDLRHLRHFVAVAEERRLRVAAERWLHTAQPSLSRQIREYEVDAQRLVRSARC